jgi:hypothetical protein
MLGSAQLEEIVPSNGRIFVTKFQQKGQLFSFEDTPLFFTYRPHGNDEDDDTWPRDGKLLPTCYVLHIAPQVLHDEGESSRALV